MLTSIVSFSTAPPGKLDLDFKNMDLSQHTGPKRKDFLSRERREKSFVRWPDQVKQTPKDLAEAGFFYCGKHWRRE